MVALASHGRADDVHIEVHEWRAWPEVASTWSMMTETCSSFFLMPESVEVWLETFGEALRPSILIFRADNVPVGACLLVRRTARKGPFLLRRVYLNTAGEDDADSPYIEFNELLCKPGFEAAMARALRSYLDSHHGDEPWDELHAPGILDGPSLDALHEAFSDSRAVDRAKPSYFVDLAAIRKSGNDFVDVLASRERTRYRQNVRKYSELGELVLEEATSTEQALAFLEALAALHQATWTSRGMPGSFASKDFCDYHHRLIRRSFPLGRIQLVRLRAGTATVGYHYSFVLDGKAHFYQCGYDYDLGEKTSPGMLVHAFAIRRALEQGLDEYDFMAGDVEYKRRMGTGARTMHWISWQAPTMKMKTFEFVRHTRRAVLDRSHDMRTAMSSSLHALTARVRGQE